MSTLRYVYWREDGVWLGYLEEFSEYWTQGVSHEELLDNLRDLYKDLASIIILNSII